MDFVSLLIYMHVHGLQCTYTSLLAESREIENNLIRDPGSTLSLHMSSIEYLEDEKRKRKREREKCICVRFGGDFRAIFLDSHDTAKRIIYAYLFIHKIRWEMLPVSTIHSTNLLSSNTSIRIYYETRSFITFGHSELR